MNNKTKIFSKLNKLALTTCLLLGGSLITESITSHSTASAKQTVYKTVKGDTLYEISLKYKVTVAALKKENNLKSNVILIGQKIKIPSKTVAKVSSTKKLTTVSKTTKTVAKVSSATKLGTTYSKIIANANKLKGTPYVFGGSSAKGIDCSGLIYLTYKQAGINLGRTSAAAYYNAATSVSVPIPGDLIFFKNTYKAGISHVGIYIGNGQMIQAGNDGVAISSVSAPYWKSHFAGYKRLARYL